MRFLRAHCIVEARNRIAELQKSAKVKTAFAARDEAAWTTAQQSTTRLTATEFTSMRFLPAHMPRRRRVSRKGRKGAETNAALAARDEAAWTAAQQADTTDGYGIYLMRFLRAHMLRRRERHITRQNVGQGKPPPLKTRRRRTTAPNKTDTVASYGNYLMRFLRAPCSRRRELISPSCNRFTASQ